MFDSWTEFWESAIKSWAMIGLMMTLERRHDLITVLKPLLLHPKRLSFTKSYFMKVIDHTFYGLTGLKTHLECWENTRNSCKSRAKVSWFRQAFLMFSQISRSVILFWGIIIKRLDVVCLWRQSLKVLRKCITRYVAKELTGASALNYCRYDFLNYDLTPSSYLIMISWKT